MMLESERLQCCIFLLIRFTNDIYRQKTEKDFQHQNYTDCFIELIENGH